MNDIGISIGTRTFYSNELMSEKEVFFKALKQAFEEIDELKNTNNKLRTDLNKVILNKGKK